MGQDSRLIKPTLQAGLVRDLLEGAKAKGVAPYILLAKAKVSPDVLANPQTRVSLQIYYRILSAIRDHLEDEMLGFFEHRIPPRAFPVMCEAATGYPTLEEAIRFANDFYDLLTREFQWTVEKDSTGNLCSLSIDFLKGLFHYKRFIIEFLMVTTYRFSGWLVGVNFPLKQVCFSFPKPETIDKYHYLLGNSIIFSADRNTLVFDAGVLSSPVIRNRREVPAFLRSSVGWFLLNPDTYPYTRKIRSMLSIRDLSSGFPHFDDLARSLNISHQHLWRKLNMEGTSYQEIKNQLRRDMAIHFLINSELNIRDIAEHVGYAAERPFYRMFTKWTGMTPGEYRQLFQNPFRRALA